MGAQKAQIGFRQPDNPSVICFANATSLYTREASAAAGWQRFSVDILCFCDRIHRKYGFARKNREVRCAKREKGTVEALRRQRPSASSEHLRDERGGLRPITRD